MPNRPKPPRASKKSKPEQAGDAAQPPAASGGYGYESVEVAGRVVKAPIAGGSKSERQAILLETSAGSYVLRRRDGNPFYDPELEDLVGKNVDCTGVLTGNTLIVSDWKIV